MTGFTLTKSLFNYFLYYFNSILCSKVYLIFGITMNTLFLNSLIRLPFISRLYQYLNITHKRRGYELLVSDDENEIDAL